MTNYTGSLTLTGSTLDSLGGRVTYSGTVGVTLTATLDSAGTGTATETVNGLPSYTYISALGVTQTGTTALDFTLPGIPVTEGDFTYKRTAPDSSSAITVTGISSNGSADILNTLTVAIDEYYASIGTVEGTATGVGTLVEQPAFNVPILGAKGAQTTQGTASIAPLSSILILDPQDSVDPVVTATVTLSDPANGTLSNLDGGSYDSTTGVYTVSGSDTADTAALDGLIFTPTVNQAVPRGSVTTGFTVTVTDSLGGGGTDTTTSVTSVQSIPPTLDNFTGTSTSDILFQSATGDVAAWMVQDGAATTSTGLGTLTNGWSIAGTGDFYGTGTDDILFRNTNGDVAQWQMQNGAAVAATTVGVTSSDWTIAGTGDFYGSGTDDVLFRNANGTITEWDVQDGVAVSASVLGQTSSDWTIAAIGNLTGGSGADSLLFINNDGAVADWNVTNGAATAANNLGQTSSYWSIVGLGDFTGNGQNDILFRGTNNEIVMWTMQNGVVTGAENIGMTTADWQIVGIGDYNGDGTTDILFRNTNGSMAAWELANGQVSNVVNVGVTSSNWQVAPAHGGVTLPS